MYWRLVGFIFFYHGASGGKIEKLQQMNKSKYFDNFKYWRR